MIKLNLLYEAKKQNALYYCRQYSYKFHAELEDDSTIRDLVIDTKNLEKLTKRSNIPPSIRFSPSGCFIQEKI